jgi:hypothetical protein
MRYLGFDVNRGNGVGKHKTVSFANTIDHHNMGYGV